MWGLSTQVAVPVSAALDQQRFDKRYKDEATIQASVSSSLADNSKPLSEVDLHIQKLRKGLPSTGTIANNIRRINQDFLRVMFRTVALMGLNRWAPDILDSDPDSIYNLVHEHIALKTFEQVSISGGYSHFPVNNTLLHDFPLMRRLYRNFVFHYIRDLAKLEAKSKGNVEHQKAMSSVYFRRGSVRCI